MVVVLISVASVIRSLFVLKMTCCTVYSCRGASLRLSRNSRNMMFSLVMCSASVGLVISFSLQGLTMTFVVRKFSIVFSWKWPVTGIVTIVVSRNMSVHLRKALVRTGCSCGAVGGELGRWCGHCAVGR